MEPAAAPARFRGTAPLADGFAVRPWSAIDDALREGWDALGPLAATPNPYFERWYLEPSLRLFDPDQRISLATLVVDGRLVALLPLERSTNYHGRRMPHFALWQHDNIFCGEPLIAPGHAVAFWDDLLAWCDRHAGAALFLHAACLPADGESHAALAELATRGGRSIAPVRTFRRAALRRGRCPQDHLEATLERKRIKELARKRRRLEEQGDFVFSRHTDATGIDQWIAEFLALESAGWKGAEGSALASAPQTEALFREAVAGAAAQGRLERIAFHLDGRPVAMLASFIAAPHGFGFKTAFDETLAKLSPGMLLQVENLSILEREDIAMSDSCAVPGHPMIEQIWSERRDMALLSIAIGGTVRRRVGGALTAIERRRESHRR